MSDIISISRHRMGTDGYGVTTLVGFYGCPLDCKYCINHACHSPSVIRAKYTARELIDVLSIDAPYFLMTHGGVTFGGGEPLLQAAYIHEVCSLMDPRWTKNIETSLFTDQGNIELLMDDIDYWFVDIKEVNPAIYRKYTGQNNQIVLQNLKHLIHLVSTEKVCVRYPIIPDFSTDTDRDKGISFLKKKFSDRLYIDKFTYIK